MKHEVGGGALPGLGTGLPGDTPDQTADSLQVLPNCVFTQ